MLSPRVFGVPDAVSAPAPRVFIVHLEERPGAVNRILSALARRAYDVGSLTVARAERPGVLRATVAIMADDRTARLLEANLDKLVDVLEVEVVAPEGAVLRELALVKVRVDGRTRARAIRVCNKFGARVLGAASSSLVVELAAALGEVDAFLEALRPCGIVELARAGGVAMAKGDWAVSARLLGQEGAGAPERSA